VNAREALAMAGFGFLAGVSYAQHDNIGTGIGVAGIMIGLFFTRRGGR